MKGEGEVQRAFDLFGLSLLNATTPQPRLLLEFF
jgi:hypothetical protein